MLYSIFAFDQPDSLTARLNARPEHLARLELLKAEGRLVLAGPNPAIDPNNLQKSEDSGFTGSLIVAEFNSLTEAENWAQADPYVAAGVYYKVLVKPFKRVF